MTVYRGSLMGRMLKARWHVNEDGGYDGDDELLSDEALDIAGIPIREQDTLTTMNDNGGPFAEIADYIEGNL